MKVWIIALTILLLVAFLLRERFTNYAQALRSVGQNVGYVNPTCSEGYTLDPDKIECTMTRPDGTIDKKTPTCPAGTQYVQRPPDPDVRTDRGEGVCEPIGVRSPLDQTIDPISEFGDIITPPEIGRTTCPAGYTKLSETGPAGNTRERCEKIVPPICPSGSEFKAIPLPDGGGARMTGCMEGTKYIGDPTCPPGTTFNMREFKCIGYTDVIRSNQRAPGSSAPATTGAGSTSSGALGGTNTSTTGGTSGNLIGPTSGGQSRSGKNIWGPVFSGFGESAAGEGGDSTKTKSYPNLLGGMMGRQSARIDGVGIVPPSQPGFGLDLGVLPSTASLGTDANARFLPFSRPQADAGFSADPYRLSKSFSTANYSPQPDPVPFLTDFSAFFK
jgi:hypothetical protein